MNSPIRLNHLQVVPVSPGGRNWNSTNLLKVDLNQKKAFYKEREGAKYPVSIAERSYRLQRTQTLQMSLKERRVEP